MSALYQLGTCNKSKGLHKMFHLLYLETYLANVYSWHFYDKALLTFYCTVRSTGVNVDVCYCSGYWSANWAALGGSLALITEDGWLPSVWPNTPRGRAKTRTLITNTIFLMALPCWLDCYTNYLPPLALRITTLNPHHPPVRLQYYDNVYSWFHMSPYLADPPAEDEDEPLPDDVSGADRLSAGQRLLLHIPPTKLPQVRVLQLPWDQLLQVKTRLADTLTGRSLDEWNRLWHWIHWAVCVCGAAVQRSTPTDPHPPWLTL